MTLDVLLRGDERLSTNINSIIFEAVHKYIQKSKRYIYGLKHKKQYKLSVSKILKYYWKM